MTFSKMVWWSTWIWIYGVFKNRKFNWFSERANL